ncbi:uncharacterized protein [Nicotiana sylvestris]|uniref:uncharacterized protein n=1 Tax=Nicotiana sylvestris TaxID=4096 RepID=UPI00388C3922
MANTRVRDLSRAEVSFGYLDWYKKRVATSVEFERPAKRPHLQEFVEASQEKWAWLTKENEYRATISKLEGKIRDLKFDSGLQAAADEGEKKRLAQENEVLRARIQKIKIAAENPVRSGKDEKLIHSLRRKVCDYGADLEKTEGELAKAQAKLAKNVEEQASFVQQLKEKYDKGITGLKKKINTLESEMTKQAKNFKAESEHCYALMSQLEEDLQQLQEQNHTAT